MIIAITVFTIFIGFVISSYLAFHRADQETIEVRSLLLELQGTMDQISETVKDSKVDFVSYETGSAFGFPVTTLFSNHALNESTLYLLSPDGPTQTVYTWDSDEDKETLSLQVFEFDGTDFVAADGYSEPVLLHGENTRVTYANFRIFPDVDPYDFENSADGDVQFQPIVQIKLSFTVPAGPRGSFLDLQTSVTSRYYHEQTRFGTSSFLLHDDPPHFGGHFSERAGTARFSHGAYFNGRCSSNLRRGGNERTWSLRR